MNRWNKFSETESVRKRLTTIVDNIYKALEDGKYHTISEISKEAKSNWKTIKKQVDLITKIQEMPKLEIIHAAKQILVKKS